MYHSLNLDKEKAGKGVSTRRRGRGGRSQVGSVLKERGRAGRIRWEREESWYQRREVRYERDLEPHEMTSFHMAMIVSMQRMPARIGASTS